MSETDQFKRGLIDHLPHLRSFARMISRDHALADDLVQDTAMQALANRTQFCAGTNLKAWLTIILRNRFFNEMRRSRRKCEIGAGQQMEAVPIDGGQDVSIEIRDFRRAFRELPAAQREALVLIGASGFSYEEAAEIVGCPIGTMKSRVSRARLDLQQQLNGTEHTASWAGFPATAIGRREAPCRRRPTIGACAQPANECVHAPHGPKPKFLDEGTRRSRPR